MLALTARLLRLPVFIQPSRVDIEGVEALAALVVPDGPAQAKPGKGAVHHLHGAEFAEIVQQRLFVFALPAEECQEINNSYLTVIEFQAHRIAFNAFDAD